MKTKIKILDLILIIIVLVLICTNLIIYINGIKKIAPPTNIENSEVSKSETSASQNSKDEQELEELKTMGERERMEHYFAKFISYIKDEKYSEAYELLYPDFRNTYFKTIDEFTKYAKKTYPSSVGFSYKSIDRQGYIYVLMIDIIDPSKKIGEEKSQRIVIQENDFNDFVLSFQVI